jgi:aryl-alcohol dehydrogenase-like predicted oxidoreductase
MWICMLRIRKISLLPWKHPSEAKDVNEVEQGTKLGRSSLQALDEVVRSGKARYIGFSNWSAWKVAAAMELQKANGWAPFTHGQMTYSLLARDVEYDVVPMMQHFGLGMTVWSPLTSGFLSGKYTRENLTDKDNRFSGFDMIPFDKEFGFSVVDRLRDVAAGHGVSVAQVALAWLLAKPAVSSVIVGATEQKRRLRARGQRC